MKIRSNIEACSPSLQLAFIRGCNYDIKKSVRPLGVELMAQRNLYLLAVLVSLSACGTRTSTSVSSTAGAGPSASQAVSPTNAASVTVTAGDITNRPYRSLGDISVTVAKWTIFDTDPTPAKVDAALSEKAAELGADAVILVRYGTVGIGAFTWGKLDGSGRAIAFTN
jgi:hypothetical protein